MTDLSITPSLRDGVRILTVDGEVDAACVHLLESALADQPHGPPLVADLSPLRFIDSSGLHALFKAAEAGRLGAIVRAPGSTVGRVLDIVGLDRVVRVFDDPAAAAGHVKERAA